jgi:hypothetical protein
MVQFLIKMPYFDASMVIANLNKLTDDCIFFHEKGREKGKFWTYKKYKRDQLEKLMAEAVPASLKQATPYSEAGL